MILYVMRHAEAVERNETMQDEWRYLTEKGRAAAEKTGKRIVKTGPKPRLTISSPLTRAVQTAEIVAKQACRRNVTVASHLLLPGAPLAELIEQLKACGDAGRVLLVGHEPQLGRLVATLLQRETETITLKKAACVALEYAPDKSGRPAEFLWYQVPGKKRCTSCKKAFSRKAVETDAGEV